MVRVSMWIKFRPTEKWLSEGNELQVLRWGQWAPTLIGKWEPLQAAADDGLVWPEDPEFVDTTFGLSRGDVNYNEEEQHHRREKQDAAAVDFDLKWLLMPCAYAV